MQQDGTDAASMSLVGNSPNRRNNKRLQRRRCERRLARLAAFHAAEERERASVLDCTVSGQALIQYTDDGGPDNATTPAPASVRSNIADATEEDDFWILPTTNDATPSCSRSPESADPEHHDKESGAAAVCALM